MSKKSINAFKNASYRTNSDYNPTFARKKERNDFGQTAEKQEEMEEFIYKKIKKFSVFTGQYSDTS
jgi:hypothetical protein